MKKTKKNQKKVAMTVARFAAGDRLNGTIRNIARTAIAFLAIFSVLYLNIFAACADDEPEPEPKPEQQTQTAEFSIKVRQSGEWTPFKSGNGVTFSNSNSSVISVSDNGTKITFTGLKAGNSTITAKHNNQVATAIVTVTDDGGGEDDPGEPTDPPPPLPPPPSDDKTVFIVDAYYSGALNGEENSVFTSGHKTIIEGIAFTYKMKIEVLKGFWLDLKNGKLPNREDKYHPIMRTFFNLGPDGEIYENDGYINASRYIHEEGLFETSTLTAEVECSNAVNNATMTVYYNKTKNDYRMEITGSISSRTSCPYVGTFKRVNREGTKIEPYTDVVVFYYFGPWETNISNLGSRSESTEKFLDLPREWIEEFMANPEKEQLQLHFDWVGGKDESWPGLGTIKGVVTMKATLDLGND